MPNQHKYVDLQPPPRPLKDQYAAVLKHGILSSDCGSYDYENNRIIKKNALSSALDQEMEKIRASYGKLKRQNTPNKKGVTIMDSNCIMSNSKRGSKDMITPKSKSQTSSKRDQQSPTLPKANSQKGGLAISNMKLEDEEVKSSTVSSSESETISSIVTRSESNSQDSIDRPNQLSDSENPGANDNLKINKV